MKNKREISRFCGQLKMLLSSGVPLLEALNIIRSIFPRKEFDRLIGQISEGESLAQAMQGHFPAEIASSVASAERAGNLEEVLGQLSRYYADRAEVEEKMKSALIYPSFVMGLCLLSFILMVFFVLPGFQDLFLGMETELPLFTRIIMSLGEIISQSWLVALLGIFTSSMIWLHLYRTRRGVLDRWLLRSKWLCRDEVGQAFRILGSLLRGGVPIVEAINTTARSTRNQAFKLVILGLKTALEEGEKMSEALARYPVFPRESVQMVSVGENSGKLDEILLGISAFYENEKELLIKRISTLVEPLLTLLVGLMVGIIAIAMFLPMVNMISGLK
ncbi:type II secretion system F family protein [Candidatus Margulisiibacteriota bacterium]